MSITAHCLVKNEENFIAYAIRSVIAFVEVILIFDTGSTDRTPEIISGLAKEFPGKIIFEEKGECDKKRHTVLRQEMVDRTDTEWFMILDGDEVWTERGMGEAVGLIGEGNAEVIQSYFFECVGDIFHTHYMPGYKTIRFAKNDDVAWQGDYSNDDLYSKKLAKPIIEVKKTVILKNKFWHATHLIRSSVGGDSFSSGGIRSGKLAPTYFLIGRKIAEPIPEVFEMDKDKLAMSGLRSFINFFPFAIKKLLPL